MNIDEEKLWKQIDAQCDAFERARLEDSSTSISDFFIGDWLPEHQRILLRELLRVELEYLATEKLGHKAAYYVDRFPDHRDVIEQCFAAESQRLDSRGSHTKHFDSGIRLYKSDSESRHRLAPGQVLGDFEIVEEIARGGMGVVYKARHRHLGRVVALKLILSGELASREEIERFQAEARAAAQLEHRHIVPVFEVGEADGRHFFSMGFVDGEDLGHKVADNLLDPQQAADLVRKLASAIGYAHRSGVLHRDITPANVLIDRDGEPRLTDFGLAKMLNVEDATDLTRTGQLLGTPSYMSPEQARGDFADVGPASDIYALGAILYFTLTGRPPFRATTVTETIRQVLQDEPVRPRAINAQVDRDLETICLACLAKEPRQRYGSCADLEDDLQRYLGGRPIRARPISLFARAVRWSKRNRTRAALIATAATLALLTVTLLGYRRKVIADARRLETARKLADSRQDAADTAHFFRLMHEAAALRAHHEPGWTWKVERLLDQANGLPDTVRDAYLLRDAIVGCQTAFDLRHLRTLGDQSPESRDLPGAASFSRNGRYFAFGQSIHEVRPQLYVYDTTDADQPKWTFSFFSGAETQERIERGDKKVDDGYRALAFSPDNRWLAAGTRFGRVFVYDLTAPHTPALELKLADNVEVKKVLFSHDGNYLYGLVPGQVLVRWENFARPQRHQGEISDFAVDPTGKRIAIAIGQDVQIRRDLNSPVDLRWSMPSPRLLAFAADGRKLAVAADVGVRQVDLTYGRQVPQVISPSSGSQEVLSLYYDGEYLVTGNREWIRIWSATSGKLLYHIPTDDPMLTMSSNHRHLAIRSVGSTQLYELRQPRVRRTLTGFTESPDNAAFTGSTLTAKASLGTIGAPHCRNYVLSWDCPTGKLLRTNGLLDVQGLHAHPPQSDVAVAPGLIASNCQPLGLVVWRSRQNLPLVEVLSPYGRSISLGTGVVAVDAGGNHVSSVTTPGEHSRLVVAPAGAQVDLRVAVPVDRLPSHWQHLAIIAIVECRFGTNSGHGITHGSIPQRTAESSAASVAQSQSWSASEFLGAQTAIVLARGSRSKWNTEIDAILRLDESTEVDRLDVLDIVVAPVGATSSDAAPGRFTLDTPRIAADGRTVWGVLDDEFVCSWDLRESVMRTRWAVSPAWLMHIYDLEVGDNWVYTAARNGCVQLTDPRNGQLVRQIPVAAKPLHNIDVASDESWMVVSGDAGKVEMRALPGGELLREIAAADVPITAQALSADQRWLVTGDASGDCVIWKHEAGAFKRSFAFPRFDEPIRDVALSADGQYLSIVVLHNSAIYLVDLRRLNEAFAEYGVAESALGNAR